MSKESALVQEALRERAESLGSGDRTGLNIPQSIDVMSRARRRRAATRAGLGVGAAASVALLATLVIPRVGQPVATPGASGQSAGPVRSISSATATPRVEGDFERWVKTLPVGSPPLGEQQLGSPTKDNGRVVLTFEGVGRVVLPTSIDEVATVAQVNTGWLVTGWKGDGTSWHAFMVDRRGGVKVLATAPWLSARPDAEGRRVGIFTSEIPYSDQARSSRLEVVTLDTGQRKTFQAPGAFGRIVDWTGDSVAVVANKDLPGVSLRVLDLTTGSWQEIPISGDAQVSYGCGPSNSVDRGLIQVRMPSGNVELRVVDDSRLVDAPIRVPRSADPAVEPQVGMSPDCRYVALNRGDSADDPLAVTDLNNGAAVRFTNFSGDVRVYGTSWESGTVLVGQVSPAVNDQALWVRWNLASGKAEQFTAPIGSGPGVPRTVATAPPN